MEKRRFDNEFKLEAVKLVEQGGASRARIARDLGICDSVLSRWVKTYGTKANSGGRLTPDEREELIRLRRETKVLTVERDILKKAVGIFTKELP
jgi:transposase